MGRGGNLSQSLSITKTWEISDPALFYSNQLLNLPIKITIRYYTVISKSGKIETCEI